MAAAAVAAAAAAPIILMTGEVSRKEGKGMVTWKRCHAALHVNKELRLKEVSESVFDRRKACVLSLHHGSVVGVSAVLGEIRLQLDEHDEYLRVEPAKYEQWMTTLDHVIRSGGGGAGAGAGAGAGPDDAVPLRRASSGLSESSYSASSSISVGGGEGTNAGASWADRVTHHHHSSQHHGHNQARNKSKKSRRGGGEVFHINPAAAAAMHAAMGEDGSIRAPHATNPVVTATAARQYEVDARMARLQAITGVRASNTEQGQQQDSSVVANESEENFLADLSRRRSSSTHSGMADRTDPPAAAPAPGGRAAAVAALATATIGQSDPRRRSWAELPPQQQQQQEHQPGENDLANAVLAALASPDPVATHGRHLSIDSNSDVPVSREAHVDHLRKWSQAIGHALSNVGTGKSTSAAAPQQEREPQQNEAHAPERQSSSLSCSSTLSAGSASTQQDEFRAHKHRSAERRAGKVAAQPPQQQQQQHNQAQAQVQEATGEINVLNPLAGTRGALGGSARHRHRRRGKGTGGKKDAASDPNSGTSTTTTGGVLPKRTGSLRNIFRLSGRNRSGSGSGSGPASPLSPAQQQADREDSVKTPQSLLWVVDKEWSSIDRGVSRAGFLQYFEEDIGWSGKWCMLHDAEKAFLMFESDEDKFPVFYLDLRYAYLRVAQESLRRNTARFVLEIVLTRAARGEDPVQRFETDGPEDLVDWVVVLARVMPTDSAVNSALQHLRTVYNITNSPKDDSSPRSGREKGRDKLTRGGSMVERGRLGRLLAVLGSPPRREKTSGDEEDDDADAEAVDENHLGLDEDVPAIDVDWVDPTRLSFENVFRESMNGQPVNEEECGSLTAIDEEDSARPESQDMRHKHLSIKQHNVDDDDDVLPRAASFSGRVPSEEASLEGMMESGGSSSSGGGGGGNGDGGGSGGLSPQKPAPRTGPRRRDTNHLRRPASFSVARRAPPSSLDLTFEDPARAAEQYFTTNELSTPLARMKAAGVIGTRRAEDARKTRNERRAKQRHQIESGAVLPEIAGLAELSISIQPGSGESGGSRGRSSSRKRQAAQSNSLSNVPPPPSGPPPLREGEAAPPALPAVPVWSTLPLHAAAASSTTDTQTRGKDFAAALLNSREHLSGDTFKLGKEDADGASPRRRHTLTTEGEYWTHLPVEERSLSSRQRWFAQNGGVPVGGGEAGEGPITPRTRTLQQRAKDPIRHQLQAMRLAVAGSLDGINPGSPNGEDESDDDDDFFDPDTDGDDDFSTPVAQARKTQQSSATA